MAEPNVRYPSGRKSFVVSHRCRHVCRYSAADMTAEQVQAEKEKKYNELCRWCLAQQEAWMIAAETGDQDFVPYDVPSSDELRPVFDFKTRKWIED